MSLLNLIVHPQVAYLVTDSGHYDSDRGGVVTRLGPKSMVVAEQRMILAGAGQMHPMYLAKGIASIKHLPQSEFIAALPNVARAAIDRYKVGVESMVAFAGYSPEQERAFGGAFMTHGYGGPTPDMAYKVLRRETLLVPPPPRDVPFTKRSDVDANPFARMLEIIEVQRQFDFSSPGKQVGCCIAGDIDVTIVSANGFGLETIHSYPATIGEKVRLEDA
jgi:hypothetical protein